jgi:hypothetical protein
VALGVVGCLAAILASPVFLVAALFVGFCGAVGCFFTAYSAGVAAMVVARLGGGARASGLAAALVAPWAMVFGVLVSKLVS